MKKQTIKNLKLNKNFVSNLSKNTVLGGFNTTNQNESQSCFNDCPTFTGQTGSWCLTGNGTNCQ
ncbi:hypothetical protein U8527_19270 [Kordia algicida OT-1]|uniref:Uncharacterized protein n=1 Tax=Kordia algicida OT-1 TaxID=391587 RepID=A9DJP2_9FLAO|nr:hypothetical protein [Kordia algicida]EDP98149.1 hypothetical protein KAOT1_13067 [Kordia algicida OT-1]